MPRYLTQDGKRVPNYKSEKAWVVVPGKTVKHSDAYLVQTKIVDYIVKLESEIKKLKSKLKSKRK